MTTALRPTTIPPLTGLTSSFRLYTTAHLPYGLLPAYTDGGPALVAATTRWHLSYRPAGRGAVTVEAFEAADDCRTSTPHQLHGRRFPSLDAAHQAAYTAGLLAYMVYDALAPRLGLPTEADLAAVQEPELVDASADPWCHQVRADTIRQVSSAGPSGARSSSWGQCIHCPHQVPIGPGYACHHRRHAVTGR